jgi:hypothetical protein
MEQLTQKQESFCNNAGLAGILIAIACLIQHLVMMIPGWITISIIGVYMLSIVAFILLTKKQVQAPLLLLISAILILLLKIFMLVNLTFSLVLVLLLVYLAAIVSVLYVDQYHIALRARAAALKADAAQWDAVI